MRDKVFTIRCCGNTSERSDSRHTVLDTLMLPDPPHWADTAVIEQVSDGYLALDREWRYTYVNGAAARATLRAPEELRGQDFWATFPDLPPEARGHLERAMERQETVHLDVQYEPLGISMRFSVVPTTEGVSIYTRDDTARRRSATLHQQMLALNAALHTDGRVQDIAQTILGLALPGVRAQGGVLALLEPGGQSMRMTRSSGYSSVLTEPWQTISMQTSVPLTDAQRRAQPLFLSESQIRQTYPLLKLGSGARRLACLPLLVDGRSIGVLGLSFTNLVPFDEDERLYLTTLSTYTAQVIQRLQYREREQQDADQHRLLLNAGGTFIWSANADMTFDGRSAAWLSFTGLNAAQSSLLATPGVVHPDDQPDVLQQAEEGMRAGLPFTLRGRIRRHDHVYRDLESRVEPVRDAAGTITGWLGVSRDVTEQRQAERLDTARRAFSDRVFALEHPEALLESVCHEVRTLLGAERVSVWHWQSGRGALDMLGSVGSGPERPVGLRHLLTAGASETPGLRAMPISQDGDTWYLLPLLTGQPVTASVVGQYGLVCRCPERPSPDQLAVVDHLGHTLRGALQRALELRHHDDRETKYRTIVEALHEGVLVVEGSQFRTMNSSVRALMLMPGASSTDQTLLGLEQWQYFTPQGEWLTVDRYPVNRSLRGESVRNQLLDARHPSGVSAWWLMNASPLPPAPDGTPKAVVTLTDVTAQTTLQRQLEYHAGHDELTGLHNRRAFTAHLDVTAPRTLGSGTQLAVIQLGLDRFKTVSDALGQHVGDELLRVSARRILDILQGRGVAASLSGDQFGVALDVTSVAQGEILAEQLRQALGEPARILEHDVAVTASAGLTFAPADGLSAQALLRNADLTMNRAKRSGRNTLVAYNDSIGQEHQRRREIERRLQTAIRRGELHLAYQPVVTLESGALTGMEALARWRSPELGVVGPAEFIPVAEEHGLIVEMGAMILQLATQQSADWNAQFTAPLRVSVNVSALQFMQRNFLSSVDSALARCGLEASRLDLELTESAVMNDLARASTLIRELRSRGVHVTLDDFGTGYSSLSVLDALPFDRIKLDRGFVWGMELSHKRQRVVRNTIAMAAALELEVVAEGIETAEQRDLLLSLGCTLGQGYLYSPPVDAADFLRKYAPN